MVFVKHVQWIDQHLHPDFDAYLPPGAAAPHAGIYRCATCGFEVVAQQGHALPATTHCPGHSPEWGRSSAGAVRWQLVAAAKSEAPAAEPAPPAR